MRNLPYFYMQRTLIGLNYLLRYALFLPLHALWRGYMSELLNLAAEGTPSAPPSASNMHPKLLKADYHGSIMTGTG